MACPFTWLSGLLFDEYRKRQTADGFTWGTEVPRLSTVVLHYRPQQQQQQQQHNAQHRTNQAANGQRGQGRGEGSPFTTTRCLREGSVPAVEQRRLFLQHHQWERASRQRTLGLAERSCVRFDSSEMSKPTALSD